ncbi:hypothetical protein 019DV002_34 [Bacillus phage 019DV002]|uniref:Uncharacterized protein n=1 Tax=Bacillus phage 019DV002 TaxID=2601653 RepID=A0A5J6T5Z6_9CAUD|nr:hypothetical protein 019DV002_34 [Bacillus phage 019DV002]QFG05262.1 hypothetical protein 019DV004_34 [Bacillus phage 019DV004]
MKQKEPFKRVTINPDVSKVNLEESPVQQLVDAFAHKIDEETEKAVIDVLRELGYDAEEGMSVKVAEKLYDKMRSNGRYINITQREDAVNKKYIVEVSVVTVARTLEFGLEDEPEQ